VLQWNAAASKGRHTAPDRALLSHQMWLTSSPELVVWEDGEGSAEADELDKRCIQTMKHVCDNCFKRSGYFGCGLCLRVCGLCMSTVTRRQKAESCSEVSANDVDCSRVAFRFRKSGLTKQSRCLRARRDG